MMQGFRLRRRRGIDASSTQRETMPLEFISVSSAPVPLADELLIKPLHIELARPDQSICQEAYNTFIKDRSRGEAVNVVEFRQCSVDAAQTQWNLIRNSAY